MENGKMILEPGAAWIRSSGILHFALFILH